MSMRDDNRISTNLGLEITVNVESAIENLEKKVTGRTEVR